MTLIKDEQRVLDEVRRALGSIREKRLAYIDQHPDQFADERAKALYVKAWVANYEISDELRNDMNSLADTEPLAGNQPSLHFARFNEFPLLAQAQHEVYSRYLFDEPF